MHIFRSEVATSDPDSHIYTTFSTRNRLLEIVIVIGGQYLVFGQGVPVLVDCGLSSIYLCRITFFLHAWLVQRGHGGPAVPGSDNAVYVTVTCASGPESTIYMHMYRSVNAGSERLTHIYATFST